MATNRHLRRRIKSIGNTAKITRAMQMVASSKMRRAQQAALAGRPYALLMSRVLGEVTADNIEFTHPLMEPREVRKRGVVLVTSDKGLCGALNSNLLREAAKLDPQRTRFVAVGRKGSQFVARTRRQLAAEFNYSDTPRFAEARALCQYVQDMFLKEEVDAVDVLFTRFINTLSQIPMLQPLLPVTTIKDIRAGVAHETVSEEVKAGGLEFLFEPNAGEVFGALLPHYLNFLVFQVLSEARASEQSARMVAMKNATENAQQLIKDLTLDYNKMRQASITNELLEITTAQLALG
ncbi:MAG: ATP synthase F1 subunit gamma [Verrucomicrobia bacterium]|nr:ATP synthase F1 subunit gamma [Verrucomicrobiota bacterium]